tara:strand:+ start:1838 stop:2002 length:165 start_codon:yes stop_codon:yes gene_type:complete
VIKAQNTKSPDYNLLSLKKQIIVPNDPQFYFERSRVERLALVSKQNAWLYAGHL